MLRLIDSAPMTIVLSIILRVGDCPNGLQLSGRADRRFDVLDKGKKVYAYGM